jgi:hypothetical protein
VTVAELYRSLSTASLRQLQAAFIADRTGADDAGRQFIDGRLALIDAELRQRDAAAGRFA